MDRKRLIKFPRVCFRAVSTKPVWNIMGEGLCTSPGQQDEFQLVYLTVLYFLYDETNKIIFIIYLMVQLMVTGTLYTVYQKTLQQWQLVPKLSGGLG